MKLFLTNCLLIWCVCLNAQDGVFAYAYNPGGVAVTLDSENSEFFKNKVQSTRNVLNDLIEARGAFNIPPPKLIMTNSEQKPAWVDLRKGEIVIEEKAFDLCMSMGQDSLSALAALLGHELVHYYENHDWTDHFLKYYGKESDDGLDHNWEDHLRLEMEADQLGGFLCIMAGYHSLGVLQELLPKIYESYQLDKTSNQSYPSLQERVKIAELSEKRVKEMNHIFMMSNFLTVAGEYEMANQYLDYLLVRSKFQSRELFNNKGVLMALSALSYFSETEMPFIIPLELDVDSRLSRKFTDKTERNKYLELAEKALRTAINLDKEYIQAYVNLASVHILQDNYFDAEYLCQKVLRMADAHQNAVELAHAHINLGIIEFLNDNPSGAENSFKKAMEIDLVPLASHNINVLNGIGSGDKNAKTVASLRMDNVSLDQLFSRIMRDEERADLHINLEENSDYFQIVKNQSKIHVHFNNFGEEGYYFFQEGNRCDFNDAIIEKGKRQEELVDILGKPSHSIPTPNGRICAYLDGGLQILYDQNNLVDLIVVKKSGP